MKKTNTSFLSADEQIAVENLAKSLNEAIAETDYFLQDPQHYPRNWEEEVGVTRSLLLGRPLKSSERKKP